MCISCNQKRKAEVSLSSYTHDFGTIGSDSICRDSITITNVGNAKLEIGEIETGCGCTQASVEKYELNPDESCSLHFLSIRKEREQVTFDKVEKGAVYLPVYYINGRVRSFNYPALLNEKGELEFLNPDNTSKRSISLKRKYPLTRKAFTTALRLKHSMFQAAHKEDFSDAVTVHTFK